METVSGSVVSTKQYVWPGIRRAEERDGSGSVTQNLFTAGCLIAGQKYFYSKDLLCSVHEITDNGGTIKSEYLYDPFGRVTKQSEQIVSLDGYALTYNHPRSNLSLTVTRPYATFSGRFLCRDFAGERVDVNLFRYCANNPIDYLDPDGTDLQTALIRAGAAEVLGGGPENPLADLAALIALIYGLMEAADASKKSDYDLYKLVCNQPIPAKLQNPKTREEWCEYWKWRLKKNTACRDMRRRYIDKWGGTDGEKGEADNMDQAVKKAQTQVDRYCCEGNK